MSNSLNSNAQPTAETPDITILIPNYNGARFIEAALDGLVQQSYQNFITIIVDDGSKDNWLELVQPYTEKLPNLQWHALENVGITANWNRAIEMVTTPFFTLLHFDDQYEPDYLKEMRALMLKYPKAGIAHCVAKTIDEHSQVQSSPVEEYKKHRYFKKPEFTQTPSESFKDLLTGSYINCPSVFYRTEAYQAIGPFNEQLRQTQDWEYWFRVGFNGYEICATSKPLFRYRRHGNNASQRNSQTLTRYEEELHLLEWAYKEGKRNHWLPQAQPGYSLLLKTVAVDVADDLANNLKANAQAKMKKLVSLRSEYQQHPIYWVLSICVVFGKPGGTVLKFLLNLAVSLSRYLPV